MSLTLRRPVKKALLLVGYAALLNLISGIVLWKLGIDLGHMAHLLLGMVLGIPLVIIMKTFHGDLYGI